MDDPRSIPPQLPTNEEQWKKYSELYAQWQQRYKEWKDGGKIGNPPPYPVRPHTPG